MLVVICSICWFPIINKQMTKELERQKKILSRYNEI